MLIQHGNTECNMAQMNPMRKVLLSIASAALYCGIFYVDLYYLPSEIQLLIPYLIVSCFCTVLVGPRTGLGFSTLAIVFWIASKTQVFSEFRTAVYIDLAIKITFVFGMYLLMRYIRKLLIEREGLLLIDDVTGASSRRGFFHLANFELAKRNDRGNYSSLFYIDLDNFKTVNDTLGHQAGNLVLKEFARVARQAVRGGDIFGRLGGDEFCLLLSNVSQDQVEMISNRIVQGFSAVCKANHWVTTLSIGIYSTREKQDIHALIKEADELMYEAKRGGRNQVKRLAIS